MELRTSVDVTLDLQPAASISHRIHCNYPPVNKVHSKSQSSGDVRETSADWGEL